MKKYIMLFAFVLLSVFNANAQGDIDLNALKNNGYGIVADAYEKMSPEERNSVRLKAQVMAKQIEKKNSKRKQKQLNNRLRNMAKELGIKDFNVSNNKHDKRRKKAQVKKYNRIVKDFKLE